MRNYIKYRQPVLNLFGLFISGGIDKLGLLRALQEFHFPMSRFKAMVLNFGDVTLTIRDISGGITKEELIVLMQCAIKNPKQFKVLYT